MVTEISTKKIKLFIEEVLKKEYGMSDYVLRCEFQHRGTIHFHLLGRIPGLDLTTTNKASTRYIFDEWPVEIFKDRSKWADYRMEQQRKLALLTEKEREDLRKTSRKLGVEVDAGDSDELIDEVVKYRDEVVKFTVEQVGTMAVHPDSNVQNWPPPYGPATAPPLTNCLRIPYSIIRKEDLQDQYCALINRVMLHKCRVGACVFLDSRNTGQFLPCRFGFSFPLAGYDQRKPEGMSDEQFQGEIKQPNCLGKFTVRTANTFVEGAEIQVMEKRPIRLLRNHPMLVEHIPEFLPMWGANIDAKVVLNHRQLSQYIMKYISKVS